MRTVFLPDLIAEDIKCLKNGDSTDNLKITLKIRS